MRVWVDMTAAAHPLVLRPIIERLRSQGHDVDVTAREYGQTLGVLDRLGIPYTAIGQHGGASTASKLRAVVERSTRLGRFVRRRRPDLALGHGSVDLALISAALRIPSVQMQDYEYAGLQRQASFRIARRVLVPDVIPVERMRRAGAAPRKLLRYPGLKEDYYLADFKPDPAVLDELGVDRDRILVVVRPPPETSAYHRANPLYEGVLKRLSGDPGVQTVVIPRTPRQAQTISGRATRNEQRGTKFIVPDGAIDAQSLIAFSDLVVSAGGTMNREAVALGTPVYTIFSGRLGAVDERLIAEGNLRPLNDPAALDLGWDEGEPGVRNPRDSQLLVDGVLGAVK
jgi:predicted glycosyltransferase